MCAVRVVKYERGEFEPIGHVILHRFFAHLDDLEILLLPCTRFFKPISAYMIHRSLSTVRSILWRLWPSYRHASVSFPLNVFSRFFSTWKRTPRWIRMPPESRLIQRRFHHLSPQHTLERDHRSTPRHWHWGQLTISKFRDLTAAMILTVKRGWRSDVGD